MALTAVQALYIHIPFCISKCRYCDFFSVPCGRKECCVPQSYIKALCNEIEYRIKKYKIECLQSVYIGGGTPSLLKSDQVYYIFNTIRRNTSLDRNCEITIEANPDDITGELIECWEKAGINRISLGIQSFSDNALSYVSRRATCDINKKGLSLIKSMWKGKLSVDLICGLPEQSWESFEEDLHTLLQYSPEHISMYSLTIEEETPLGHDFYNGMLNYDFDYADDLWLRSKDILEENGYIHYEVSNFSLPQEQCRHNLKYWNHESYIGCGSGGAGSVYNSDGSGTRWTNIKDITKYCNFWNSEGDFNNESPFPESVEYISVETSMFEFFMMGLRKLSGIREWDFKNIFSCNIPEKIVNVFNKWNEKGLCEIKNNETGKEYSLGHRGILYLNCFLEEII